MTVLTRMFLASLLVIVISLYTLDAADEEYPTKPKGYVLPWLFPEYIKKRGCDTYGDVCDDSATCCEQLYCNSATGRCEECLAKGQACNFFIPCCHGTKCTLNKSYDGVCLPAKEKSVDSKKPLL